MILCYYVGMKRKRLTRPQPKIVMTYEIARAAGVDAANHQMRSNHRTEWNLDDYNLACRTMARLFPQCGANPKAGLADDPRRTQ